MLHIVLKINIILTFLNAFSSKKSEEIVINLENIVFFML